MNRYTLLRHLGEPRLKSLQLQFESVRGEYAHLGKRTAAEIREIASRLQEEAKQYELRIKELEADIKLLCSLADEMEAA